MTHSPISSGPSRRKLLQAGAAILGDPLPLASALEKLEWAAGRTHPPTHTPAAAHLYIVNPLRGGSGLLNLFRTHPASEERIRRLRALSLSGRGGQRIMA